MCMLYSKYLRIILLEVMHLLHSSFNLAFSVELMVQGVYIADKMVFEMIDLTAWSYFQVEFPIMVSTSSFGIITRTAKGQL